MRESGTADRVAPIRVFVGNSWTALAPSRTWAVGGREEPSTNGARIRESRITNYATRSTETRQMLPNPLVPYLNRYTTPPPATRRPLTGSSPRYRRPRGSRCVWRHARSGSSVPAYGMSAHPPSSSLATPATARPTSAAASSRHSPARPSLTGPTDWIGPSSKTTSLCGWSRTFRRWEKNRRLICCTS